MSKKIYEPIPHTADIKMRAYGDTLEKLFINSLRGMFCSIEPISKEYGVVTVENLPNNLDRHHEISLSAPSKELLLIDFLSEALYLSDVNDEAYFDATFSKFSEISLTATLQGIKIERFQVVEIKAVTYHGLKVEKINNSWQAEVVFDI